MADRRDGNTRARGLKRTVLGNETHFVKSPLEREGSGVPASHKNQACAASGSERGEAFAVDASLRPRYDNCP